LNVDLNTKMFKKEIFPQDMKKTYLGGRGVNSKLLSDQLKPKIDPLSEKNILVVSPGLLVGLKPTIPAASRVHISAKSPLTGIMGSSNVGGHFGPELKSVRIESIAISGCAERPTYLWIEDETIQLRDATDLWGMDTLQTESAIKKQHDDPKIKTLFFLSILLSPHCFLIC